MNNLIEKTTENITNNLISVPLITTGILGFLLWAVLSGIHHTGLGFILSLLVLGLGLFLTYIFKMLLIAFDEIAKQHSELMQLLKNLPIHNNTSTSTAVQVAQSEKVQSTQPDLPVKKTPYHKAIPADGQSNSEAQPAIFESRSSSKTVVCPICGKEQISLRDFCFRCGLKFVFLDELPLPLQKEIRSALKTTKNISNHANVKPAPTVGVQPSNNAVVMPNREPETPNTQSKPDEKTETFKSRSLMTIICPICNKDQSSIRDSCFNCGCKFIYKDEQPK